MADEKAGNSYSDHKKWEFIKEVSGYKLCVTSDDNNIWKYKLLNIAVVMTESNVFNSKDDAIKNGSEKAKKLKIEKDEHLMEIKRYFKKL